MDLPEKFFHVLGNTLSQVFLSVGSDFSLTSLFAALCFAVLFLVFKLRRKGRPARLGALLQALFPKRITKSPSHRADVRLFLLNVFVFGAIFGWAVLSYQSLSAGVGDLLAASFGAPAARARPELLCRVVITVTLFLAYELGYWIDHYLKHSVPFLWEFHRVHHTAQVLTPLTVWRVHPLDTLIFVNILALVTGIANGTANYLLGGTVLQFTIAGNNLLLVLFIHSYVHLQHTHLWIAFRGALGRILLSPAHHQVHHSSNPAHFNRNFGSCLAVWDYLFGTLHIPAKERERLTFGVDAEGRDAHGVSESLLAPMARALARLGLMPRDRPAALGRGGDATRA